MQSIRACLDSSSQCYAHTIPPNAKHWGVRSQHVRIQHTVYGKTYRQYFVLRDREDTLTMPWHHSGCASPNGLPNCEDPVLDSQATHRTQQLIRLLLQPLLHLSLFDHATTLFATASWPPFHHTATLHACKGGLRLLDTGWPVCDEDLQALKAQSGCLVPTNPERPEGRAKHQLVTQSADAVDPPPRSSSLCSVLHCGSWPAV